MWAELYIYFESESHSDASVSTACSAAGYNCIQWFYKTNIIVSESDPQKFKCQYTYMYKIQCE